MDTPLPGAAETKAINALAADILAAMNRNNPDRAKDLLQDLRKHYAGPGLLMAMSEWVRLAEDAGSSEQVFTEAEAILAECERARALAGGVEDPVDAHVRWACQWVCARVVDDVEELLALVEHIKTAEPSSWVWVLLNLCSTLAKRGAAASPWAGP